MPYNVKVVHTTLKDTDGSNIKFDVLAGNYEKEIPTDPTSDETTTDSENDGV